MALTLADLYASPDHYLQAFDGDAAIFVPMDRAAYHRSIFLDGRISPAGAGQMRVALDLFVNMPPPQPTGWIFHIAHCGSTLLARALDGLSGNLVLREPLALRQSAVAGDAGRLALAAAMASKRYRTDVATVVKANVPVNFVLPELIALQDRPRAILLYLPLRDYLLAILRSDNHRDWLRRVSTQLGPKVGDVAGLADGARAAALWLAQMRAFAGALAALPRARTCNAEDFFANPAPVLKAAVAQLQVDMTDAAVAQCVAGDLFNTYSKNPNEPFDNDARLTRRAALEASLAHDIALGEAWLAHAADERRMIEAQVQAADLLG
ncbi:hypothetical protein [uncultured Sphingomonas sp.]|uniref:hypothetical protein n=1 Tax=uncultured Sphingomonas sp. TaxID=158754 RepID=UPI0025D5EA95|nr:hypothetical protein [uncultured Sphingomonas sp.]